jgi:hypothetical protein
MPCSGLEGTPPQWVCLAVRPPASGLATFRAAGPRVSGPWPDTLASCRAPTGSTAGRRRDGGELLFVWGRVARASSSLAGSQVALLRPGSGVRWHLGLGLPRRGVPAEATAAAGQWAATAIRVPSHALWHRRRGPCRPHRDTRTRRHRDARTRRHRDARTRRHRDTRTRRHRDTRTRRHRDTRTRRHRDTRTLRRSVAHPSRAFQPSH